MRKKESGENKDDSQEGSIALLVLGLAVVSLLIASFVIGVTSVYLEYKKLQDLADQTALSVAQDVRGLSRPGNPTVKLTDDTVRQYSAEFLQSSGQTFTSLSLSSPTGLAGADTAQVTISAVAQIPFLSSVVPVSVPISATGTAQTLLSR